MRQTKTLLKSAMLAMAALITAGVGGVKAEDLTAEQALAQARSFIHQREAAGSRPMRAPGMSSQLSMTRQVSGLYIFNVADDGGYVIVSSDDRATPILGFSDSGAFDPDNMPDNMRGWLEGYADQIAWLKTQDAPGGKSTQSMAPRHVGSHSTATIEPLVTTKWNQDTPFNDQCPYTWSYTYSKHVHCASGCVATAMAQVMKYHQWPAATTKTIPSYQLNDSWMGNLDVTTFDWANMLDFYPFHLLASGEKVSDCTEAQGTAVATLLKYCGWGVKMQYGPESGSNSLNVVNALKEYFDYNATTTQMVRRNYYTAAKWADLIYHELAHLRPVIYSGQSSGGGHEFVCDGYKYEGGSDFFHINWGWGGLSDGYFALSALDPLVQGIGGSTSTDGYCCLQDAVIGIQKSTENGTVSDKVGQPNTINLTVNSATYSIDNPNYNEPTKWVPMTITVNITNNSDDDYEGDFRLGYWSGYYDYGYYTGITNIFIASGETKDIAIPFIPGGTGTYSMVYYLPRLNDLEWSTNQKVIVTFTVNNSANINEFVPIYGNDCDESVMSQFIIPADNLTPMANQTLYGVTFYASTLSPISWGDAQFEVYLKEVEESSFKSENPNSSYGTPKDWTTMTKVYSGSLSVGSDGRMVVRFTAPYQYGGGNLLVGFKQIQSGSWATVKWLGTSSYTTDADNYCYYPAIGEGKNSNDGLWDILPQTTFDYSQGLLLADNADNSAAIEGYNNQQVDVTLAGRTLYRDGKWNTLTVPFNVTLAGSPLADATARPLTSANITETTSGTTLNLNFGNAVDELVAGTPYIIKWDAATTNIESPAFTGVTVSNARHDYDNNAANADQRVRFLGTYKRTPFTDADQSILLMGGGNTLYYPTNGAAIGACRAYFKIGSGDALASRLTAFNIRFTDEATGITTTDYMDFTDGDAAWYTLDGRRLSTMPMQRGVYIRNGRKIIIK